VGWEKVASWITKAAIFLKRVKIEEKLLWRAYRKSLTLFRTVTSLTPTGTDENEATDFKFGRNIQRVHPNKRPLD